MSTITGLSDAQVLLLATNLASEGQIDGLRRLASQRADVLRTEITYRIILTYCAEDVPTQELILLLKGLQGVSGEDEPVGIPIDASSVQSLDDRAVRKRVRHLNLRPLPGSLDGSQSDKLLLFLQARALHVDSSSDDLIALAQLVVPFIEESQAIQDWFVSRLLPLLRLKYEYYPDNNVTLSLRDLDVLDRQMGVSALLQYGEREPSKANIGRDLRNVVAPWIHGGNGAKRRKLGVTSNGWSNTGSGGWQEVNKWMLTTSLNDLDLVEKAFIEWNGPQDVDMGGYQTPSPEDLDDQSLSRYSQVGLAIIYASNSISPAELASFHDILQRVSVLAGLPSSPEPGQHFPPTLTQCSKAALLQNRLLRPDNDLTWPTTASIAFLQSLIRSIERLQRLKSPLTVKDAAELCLLGSEESQRQELRRLMQQASQIIVSLTDWRSTRDSALWLQSWGAASHDHSLSLSNWERRALLWRLDPAEVEIEVLSAMLSASHYDIAVKVYAKEEKPLPSAEVEQCVIAATLNAYDNASNGNRTRGGMERAYKTLKAFQPYFLHSTSFREIDSLIAGTHALSFYQLTLQYGVPFKPVNIRIHQDPISLIEKVLEQNLKAYTKLDDLLNIGRNFVEAGLLVSRSQASPTETRESKILDAEHRITYLAVTSALSSNDFDTAYSYITTRLSQSPARSSEPANDTSWRAAYAAGRHRVPSSKTFQSRITMLSRRMELLSLALTLAPTPEPLPEILVTWREFEDEMESLKTQEAQEARAHDEKLTNRISFNGSSLLPGGFGMPEDQEREDDMAETARMAGRRRAEGQKSFRSDSGMPAPAGYEDEAPMGLFDVAKAATNAFQRSARGVWDRPAGLSLAGQGKAGSRGFGSPGWMEQAGEGTPRTSRDGKGAWGQSSLAGLDDVSSPVTMPQEVDGRIRKRDRISGAVTGRLVSGLGWVLGAQPVRPVNADEDDEDDDE